MFAAYENFAVSDTFSSEQQASLCVQLNLAGVNETKFEPVACTQKNTALCQAGKYPRIVQCRIIRLVKARTSFDGELLGWLGRLEGGGIIRRKYIMR